MRLMVLSLVVMVFYIAVSIGDRDEATQQMAEVAYQADRVHEQDQILVDLESMEDPAVSQFVEDWRRSFPEPSSKKLTELKVIAV